MEVSPTVRLAEYPIRAKRLLSVLPGCRRGKGVYVPTASEEEENGGNQPFEKKPTGTVPEFGNVKPNGPQKKLEI